MNNFSPGLFGGLFGAITNDYNNGIGRFFAPVFNIIALIIIILVIIQGNKKARLFAPDIISTGMDERDYAITPDGNEIFFSREAGNFRYVTIFFTRRTDGLWSVPEVFEYCINPAYKYVEPHLSPDGKQLYFMSDRLGRMSPGKLSAEMLQEFHNSPQNGNTDIHWVSTSLIEEMREKARF